MKLRQHNVKQLLAAFKLLPEPTKAGLSARVKVHSVDDRIESVVLHGGKGFEDDPGTEDIRDIRGLTFTFMCEPYYYTAFDGAPEQTYLEWELVR